ncbi:TetR/AcrR family transcriptional regulator [Streptomyces boncukensis]|uniref:TetR family transcriptional regulator n=1 Tax=Streptomyces boncukensis TaxID=2711219 RepID=A0A6G4WWA4_9ACTN|nr:TetR/AcrR family transcriptional regulator [Streptomyces boncukensis]NGO68814.1 TetR family transcriptional regulator [Streptomyces boncukensis]
MAGSASASTRGGETREQILAAAERLFAERGVAAVSNRQVSEAAGQANNYAVGYHFGSKTELVLAVVRKHDQSVELRRAEAVAATRGSERVRDWVHCLVRPTIDYLAALEPPTWLARFLAQAMTEPSLRAPILAANDGSPTLREVRAALTRLLPMQPEEVRDERSAMARHLLVHMCAERERALHEGGETPRATWEATGTGLIDAITAVFLAPATPVPPRGRGPSDGSPRRRRAR